MVGTSPLRSQSCHWCSMSDPEFTYANRSPRFTEPGSMVPMRSGNDSASGVTCEYRSSTVPIPLIVGYRSASGRCATTGSHPSR